jgi:ketosteroid isomerase-like protein
MRTSLSVAGLLVALVALFCTPLLADDLEELKAKLEETSAKITKATLAGDIETEYSFYTDDLIYMPEYSPMLKGKEAVRKHAEEMKKAGYEFHSMDFAMLDVWTCGDLVYEVGSYGISLTIPGMPMPVADKGKYLTVWEKGEDGSLKIKLEIWNTDINPADWSKMQMHEGEHHEKGHHEKGEH